MVYWVIGKVPVGMEAYSYQMVNLILKAIALKTGSFTFQYSSIPLFLPRETYFLFHWGHHTRQKLRPLRNIIIFPAAAENKF